MREGQFREDLFYRLNVVTLSPARRCASGGGDIPLLVEHFLAKYAERLGERGGRPRRPRPARRPRLAGQRARAGERHPARDGDGRQPA